MPMSNYPGGFMNGVMVRELPLLNTHPGKIIYVNNSGVLPERGVGASDSNPGTYNAPMSTIDAAIGMCTAGRGDIILVMPGHAETLATASAITLDVAGVSIVGLGRGSLQPTLSFSATASTMVISANNCALQNIKLKATIDSVVTALTVSGADAYLDLESADTSSVEFISVVTTTAAADRLQLKLRHRGFTAGDAMTKCIALVGTDNAKIDVDFYGIASTAVVNMLTTACLGVDIRGVFHNGTTAISKNVVDTQGSSKYIVNGYDEVAGSAFIGGSGSSAHQTDIASPAARESGAKTLGAGDTTLFTIAGGPIKVLEIVGIVTTIVQAQATSCKLTMTTLSPAGTVDMSAAAVDLTGAAAGTSIRHINTTAILTPVTAGFVMEGNAFATQDTAFLCPAGTISLNNASAANTGAITWYLRYVPLSQYSRVS